MRHWPFLFLFLYVVVSCDKPDQNAIATSNSNVYTLKDSFAVMSQKEVLVYRKIWLYLPPNYSQSSERYPVLYMHDGQNLFDATTSYAGEWKVDETLNKLHKETGKGFIVVGIENTGAERLNEYSPWVHEKYGGGNGNRYLNMIVAELKPYIDRHYRTLTDAEHTGIIGSSMGGLISYYAGLKHPEVFGKIGALSTSFWFSNKVFDFTKTKGSVQQSKLYMLVGGKEGGSMSKDMQAVENLLRDTGFPQTNLNSKLVAEGKHNEAFWSGEFKEIVTWLYNIQ